MKIIRVGAIKLANNIFMTLGAALILASCASAPSLPQQSNYTESSPFVYATLDDAVRAATAALAENRLGSATVERTTNGASVRASLSGMEGLIYNSYGGSGSVTMSHAFPGSKRLTISAVTRSRIAGEPVTGMDALKGFNYNNPKYAVEIVQRIKEMLPSLTQEEIARLQAEDEATRIALQAEAERKAAAEAAMLAQDRAIEAALAIDAERGSRFACANDTDCRKAFSMAQIYVSTKTDMKIQFATDTIIETYNPTETGKMGAKVIKMPKAGQNAEIVLSVSCRECAVLQRRESLRLMKEFRQFVDSSLSH